MPCNKAKILGHEFKKKVSKAEFLLEQPFYNNLCFKVDEINVYSFYENISKYHFCYFQKLVGYLSFVTLIATLSLSSVTRIEMLQ